MMLRKHISDNYINNQSFFGESKKGSQQRKNNSNSRSGFRPNKLFVVYDCFGKLPSNTTMVKLISFYVFIHLFTFSCPSLLRTSRNCLSRNQPNMFISRAGGGSRKWVSFSSHTSTFKYTFQSYLACWTKQKTMKEWGWDNTIGSIYIILFPGWNLIINLFLAPFHKTILLQPTKSHTQNPFHLPSLKPTANAEIWFARKT